MKRYLTFLLSFLFVLSSDGDSQSEERTRVTFSIVEFSPKESVSGVPIQIIFVLTNDSEEAVAPYGEVNISGIVRTKKGRPVYNIQDKTFRVYNFYPGSRSAKQWLYIGPLRAGEYVLQLRVNTFNRAKGVDYGTQKMNIPLYVK